MSHPPILTGHGLTLGYRHRPPLLIDAALTLLPRQIAVLLGANGAGKSTLLRALAGLQPPLMGDIRIQAQSILGLAPALLARLRALVLSHVAAPHGLTAADAVALGRAPHTNWWGQLQAADHLQIQEAMSTTECLHLADRQLHTLSDGERQKVLLARARAQDTPLLLLDEPTAHLDVRSRVQLLRLLHRTTRHTGKAAIIAGHDLDLLLQVADVIWLLPGDGHLHVLDPASESQAHALNLLFGLDASTWEEGQIALLASLPDQQPLSLDAPKPWHRGLIQALRRQGFNPVSPADPADWHLASVPEGWLLHSPGHPPQLYPDFTSLLPHLSHIQ